MKNRKMLTKIVLVISVILSITLVGCGLVKMNPEADKNQVVAKIDGETIKKDQFLNHMILTEISLQLSGQSLPSDEETLKQIKEDILNNLVENEMLAKLAKDENMEIDEADAQTQLDGLNEMLFDSYGGEEEYNAFLDEKGVTREEFDEFLLELAENNIYINELYVYITKDIEITDEEAKEYYNVNLTYFDSSTVSAKHILVQNEELANEVAAKAKEEGMDFDAVMELYKGKEGVVEVADLGAFKYTDMVPDFAAAAFSLGKEQVSPPVHSSGYTSAGYYEGYHIIYVYDKNIVEPVSFEDSKDYIKESLLANKKDETYSSYFEEKREDIDLKTYPNRL